MSMSEKYDLKPCPFCGSTCRMVSFFVDEYDGALNNNTLIMQCNGNGCGIEFRIERCFGSLFDVSPRTLFAMWNRRAGEKEEEKKDALD